ncbi:uncharacterized protein [Dermacentor albipictus]|uniref:uncharacterized protein isoform X2 n=1 Tax=Dermacentor albipictus TaxID=60249 RepID=UPI0038FC2F23
MSSSSSNSASPSDESHQISHYTSNTRFSQPPRYGQPVHTATRRHSMEPMQLAVSQAEAHAADQVLAEAKARFAAHTAAMALARVAAKIVTPAESTAPPSTPTTEPTAPRAPDEAVAEPLRPPAGARPSFSWAAAPPNADAISPPAQSVLQSQQESPNSEDIDAGSQSDTILTSSAEDQHCNSCRNARTTKKVEEVTKIMIPSTTRSTTSTLPPSFGELYSHDLDVPDATAPQQRLCSLPIRMREVFSGIIPTSQPFVYDDSKLQHRRIFCFFDSQYWRASEFYHAENLPLSYCTDVVFGTRALYNNNTPEAKASESSYILQRKLISDLQLQGKLRHRGKAVLVYEAIGGDRRDSHNFSYFLSKGTSRFLIADFYTAGIKGTLQGVYVDWDYPGDACGSPNDTDNLIAFMADLRSLNFSVILAVPPKLALMSVYNLPRAMSVVKYVVVKTHTLRLSSAVYCSGARQYAARIFNDVRNSLPPQLRHKLAYSISVAPDTFTARDAVMGAVSLGPSMWENYTKKPDKTHYAAICHMNVTRFPEHPECALVSQGSDTYFKVAAFAGPEELQTRMRRAYDDGMGDVPVVVYDVDLDDFKGYCPAGVMSPLIRALAITTYNT